MAIKVLFILCAYLASFCVSSNDINLAIGTHGDFNVNIGVETWLSSGPIKFTSDGVTYSSAGALAFDRNEYISGKDSLGVWEGVSVYFTKQFRTEPFVHVSLKKYDKHPFIVFEQVFDVAVNNASIGDVDKISSVFPNFKIDSTVDLGYMSYGGIMVGNTNIKQGRFMANYFDIVSGLNSGPMALFDKLGRTIFISSFNNFMVSSAVHDKDENTYGWGILGSMEQIPQGFVLSTSMYYSDKGIGESILGWGKLMRKYYNKPTSYRDSDLTISHLSYWSDNGAYYVNYYLPPPYLLQNMTYEEAMLKEVQFAQQQKIPYRSIQYSVWFKQGKGAGISLWEANPKLFPSGMKYMFEKTHIPATAHNRWWTPDTPYAKQNGGLYSWIIEERFSLPMDQKFWDDFFVESRQLGFTTLMQDWLNNQFGKMKATTSTVDVAKIWLQQMGEGARKAGLTIQYCMAMSRHILQSLEIPTVNQARASTDYHPGSEAQYQIGISSLFAHAVGIAPFKDTFWTVPNQPENYYNATEPYPALHVAVATLSTGPVGPGDMVGATNRSLLMKCCREDGLILKPSRPAFAIDAQMKAAAFGMNGGLPYFKGELWTTYTDISGYRFGIVLGAMMKGSFDLHKNDTGIFRGNMGEHLYVYNDEGQYSVYDDNAPLKLDKQCAILCVYYIAPSQIGYVGGQPITLLGELTKYVPMSPQRVSGISQDKDDIKIHVKIAENESMYFTYLQGTSHMYVMCVYTKYTDMYISIKNNSCDPEIA